MIEQCRFRSSWTKWKNIIHFFISLLKHFSPFLQLDNFVDIMSKNTSSFEKETPFAEAALMEIPFQHKETMEFGILGYDPN